MSVRDEKPIRMRDVLAFAFVLMALMLGAAAVCLAMAGHESGLAAVQQQQVGAPTSRQGAEHTDPTAVGVKQTAVPKLGALIGLSPSSAIDAIGHGATEVATAAAEGEGPAATVVTVALTTERSDPRTGAPTVYLGVDGGGRVCAASYSVSLSSLGYSNDLTFRQAIQAVQVVDHTFADAGIAIEEGSVSLPLDRAEYCTYLSDGTTVLREEASFSGQAEYESIPLTWDATLEYDFSAAIDSGNLADAVHLVSIGITAA